MGIPGIIKELGTGACTRIALSKLAHDFLNLNKRPIRVAIDTPIWLFHCQSAPGGKNPQIRTLLHKLNRILELPINPLFVFDGRNKPALKRNKKSRLSHTAHQAASDAKILIRLFGFQAHDAPGEAEAECATLQQAGIVDAVMSDDADTLMFGSTRTIMNWSREGSRGNGPPTHVDYFDNGSLERALKLDRAGMIVFAMCSGGDYCTKGLPGCGSKIALEIGKAGYGSSLLDAASSEDVDAKLSAWRADLTHELHTNESRYFASRHKKLAIPESFPDMTVLSYYTNPAVSTSKDIKALERTLKWDQEPDINLLRNFVDDKLNWCYLSGAKYLIRGLAPKLLGRWLVLKRISTHSTSVFSDASEQERCIVRRIIKRKDPGDFVHDGQPELQIEYVPISIVPIRLDQEQPNPSDETEVEEETDNDEIPSSQQQPAANRPRKKKSPYDPTQPEITWVLESLVKWGAPALLDDWENEQLRIRSDAYAFASRNAPKAKKAPSKSKTKTSQKGTIDAEMRTGALDRFISRSESKSIVEASVIVEAQAVAKKPSTKQTSTMVIKGRVTKAGMPSSSPISHKGSTGTTENHINFDFLNTDHDKEQREAWSQIRSHSQVSSSQKAKTKPGSSPITRDGLHDFMNLTPDIELAETGGLPSTMAILESDEDNDLVILTQQPARLYDDETTDVDDDQLADDRTVTRSSSLEAFDDILGKSSFISVTADKCSSFAESIPVSSSHAPIPASSPVSNFITPTKLKATSRSKPKLPRRSGTTPPATSGKVTRIKASVRIRESLPGHWATSNDNENNSTKEVGIEVGKDKSKSKKKARHSRVSIVDLTVE